METTSLLTSLGDVADLINSGSDTNATLRQLIVAACRHGGWLRGSIMSVDLPSGYAYVTVRYDPRRPLDVPTDQWELATSPALVALQSDQPVFIPDAKVSKEFPGFQRESIKRDYSSVLVMPMRSLDLLGRPMVLTVISHQIKEVSETDFSLMKLIVHLGSIAIDKQKAIAEQEESAAKRQLILATHTRLMQQAISDDSVEGLAQEIYPIATRPILIVDRTTGAIVAGPSPNSRLMSDPEWSDIVDGQLRSKIRKLDFEAMQSGRSNFVEMRVSLGYDALDLSARTVPLRIDGQVVGAMLVFGDPDFSELDELLLDSVRLSLSVQLMRNMIRFQFERRTLDELWSELADGGWKNEKDIAQRALKLGLRTDRAHRIIAVGFADKAGPSPTALGNMRRGISLLFDRTELSSLVAVRDGRIVILLPTEPRGNDDTHFHDIMNVVMREIRNYAIEEPAVILSEPCSTLTDYARVWARCETLLGIAESFGRRGMISADDFGPLPVLLSGADTAYVGRFIRGRLEPILTHDSAHGTDFYQTLEAYAKAGFRNQQCADAIGIHVTTLRYRLSRIAELFGLDLETADQRFEIEFALRLATLLGPKAVPAN